MVREVYAFEVARWEWTSEGHNVVLDIHKTAGSTGHPRSMKGATKKLFSACHDPNQNETQLSVAMLPAPTTRPDALMSKALI